MFVKKLLKVKIIEREVPISEICNKLGICEATFYRKLSRNGDFSRREIEKIVQILRLSRQERDDIFFAK